MGRERYVRIVLFTKKELTSLITLTCTRLNTIVMRLPLLIILAVSFTSIGCTDLAVTKLVTKLEIESRPSYLDVQSEDPLPHLPESRARLFVFKTGMMSVFDTELCLNEKRYTLEDGTWFFVDLTPGTYTLTKRDRSENTLNFELKPGEELLVGVGDDPYLRVVNAQYAIENFASYNYTLAALVSFDSDSFVKKYYIRSCR